MQKIAIGTTGLSVTPLGFGTSALGDMPDTYGYGVSEQTARETLQCIFEGPVNLIDTSRNYGFGRSEARIGAALRERGGLPEGFVLSTKLDRDMETGRFDGDRARRSVEESLEALGIDRFQILHLHDPEHARDLDEVRARDGAITALMRMQEEGLVTATGLAMGRLDIMTALLAEFPFDIALTHNRYTLLNRSAEALLAQAAQAGCTVFNAAPYAGGVLAKGSTKMPRITYQAADTAALAPVVAVESLCASAGVAPGAVALQFSMRAPGIASTIIGVSRPERVQQTLEWAQAEVPDTLWEALSDLPAEQTDPEANRTYKPG